MERLPLRTDLPDYTLSATLDDVLYVLRLRWSARESSWYLDILDADREPVRLGIKVVINFPLAVRGRNPALPAGRLVAIDTTGQNIAPGIDELGDRVQIFYATADEMDEIITAADAEVA